MTDSILNDIWSKVKAVHIDHNLSDERLFHLGGIYLSLHELNAYIRRDDAARKRSAILCRVASLFDECVSRCRDCEDSGRLGRFVPLLYRLARLCLVPVKDEWLYSCDTVAEHLVDLWLRQESYSWEEAHGAMRVVVELTSMLNKPERENDPAFRKYRSELAAWCEFLSENYAWENIPDIEALGRLVIMDINSDVLLDETFDDSFSQAYLYYKQKMSHGEIPLSGLSLLLELENRMVCRQGIDMDMIGVIWETALKNIGYYTPDGDEYWRLLSVLTECICAEQLDVCRSSVCIQTQSERIETDFLTFVN
mgnify:CR=1 FL=1